MYEFVRSMISKHLINRKSNNKATPLTPPLNLTITGAKADLTKMYSMNENLARLPTYKIATNCHEFVF